MTNHCSPDNSANQTIQWLRELARKGGKGVVNNIDARCLGRIADELERLRAECASLREANKTFADHAIHGVAQSIAQEPHAIRDALVGLNAAVDDYWNHGRTDGCVKNICYWQFKAKEALTPLSSTHRGPTAVPDASTPALRPRE